MKLIIYNDTSEGGIADYSHDQAAALAARGIDVTVLCSEHFLSKRKATYHALPVLHELRAGKIGTPRALRRVQLVFGQLRNVRVLAEHVAKAGNVEVLMHFSEYFAPLWAPRLRRLRKGGARFHSVLHDPVRDYRIGPGWWHDWSVREVFRLLSNVFVHTEDTVPVPATIPVTYIPYGVHPYPAPQRTRGAVRAELGVPDDMPLITAYGYVRDNKNLDLVITALARTPGVRLLVAGPEIGGANRPVSFFKALAAELGVADRCIWQTRFVSAADAADLLGASDLSVLTYSRSFVSSSAALGVTTNYKLPCLISSGSGTTRRIVETNRIGIWVEPDDAHSIEAGLKRWLAEGISPDWESYNRDNNWMRNAALVEDALVAAREAGR